jgi:hypothetical protein
MLGEVHTIIQGDRESQGVNVKTRTVSVFIKCPPSDLYGFVADPLHLPEWAHGLCRSIRRQAGAWVVDGPLGEVGFRFALRNSWGVLDHVVTLSNGQEIVNPMRVVARGAGSEVLFTLFQPEEMSDLQFVEDVATVERDLRTLKQILEG